MKLPFRNVVLVSCLLLGAAASAPAKAADTVMNIGWETPLDSSYGVLAKKFKELAEQYSDNTIEVKFRCCGQIATEDNAFKALQLGTVDAYIISQNNISPNWPLMDVFVLPYVFKDADQLVKVTEGEVGDAIKSKIQKETSVHLLTFGGPSYRDFFNSKRPIEKMSDMDGLKIRVPKNEVMLDTFAAFGAEPVPLAWSETPTALQTKTIDGGDNGTNVIQEMKFYEFAPYLTVLDHFVGVSPLLASDRFMSRLTDAQREAVVKAAKEAGEFHTRYSLDQIKQEREWLTSKGGMKMTEPDRAPFIEAAKKVQEKFATQRGEEFVDLVTQIQNAQK